MLLNGCLRAKQKGQCRGYGTTERMADKYESGWVDVVYILDEDRVEVFVKRFSGFGDALMGMTL